LGDLSKQIEVDARGEILDLKNTVNGMVVRCVTGSFYLSFFALASASTPPLCPEALLAFLFWDLSGLCVLFYTNSANDLNFPIIDFGHWRRKLHE
jgi:hypothetical protein